MTKKTALLACAAIVATFTGVAVADICTYGSKFHIHGTYTYEDHGYFISQDFGWTKVPLNTSCAATARVSTVECKL